MNSRVEIEDHLSRMALGDSAAFDALYAATSAKLFGIALRVLGNRAEAEDALQEIYIKVWKASGSYQTNGLSPMSWLITIARNHAIDRLRMRRKNHDSIDERFDIADKARGPEQLAIDRSERSQLDKCLAQLPQDRSAAVRSAYLDGDTYKDLAKRYNVPLNTIRTWLRRSLLKLRECLAP